MKDLADLRGPEVVARQNLSSYPNVLLRRYGIESDAAVITPSQARLSESAGGQANSPTREIPTAADQGSLVREAGRVPARKPNIGTLPCAGPIEHHQHIPIPIDGDRREVIVEGTTAVVVEIMVC